MFQHEQGRIPRAKHWTLLLALFVALSLGSLGLEEHSLSSPIVPLGTGAKNGPAKSALRLALNQNFNATTMSGTFWQPTWLGPRSDSITGGVSGTYDQNCFSPTQVVPTALGLRLVAVHMNCQDYVGQQYPYKSGLVNSSASFNFSQGFVEVRAKTPVSSCTSGDKKKWGNNCVANHPAVWLNSPDGLGGRGEIDIMEGLQGQICELVHFWKPGVIDPNRRYCTQLANPTAWHTYGALWRQGQVVFYLDGKRTMTVAIPSAFTMPMYVVMDEAVPSKWQPTTPSSLDISYVRVWSNSATGVTNKS
jgi:Glycosyl hydrolases family 16